MWWLIGRGCGGSLAVHQTVKPAVPGSNPTSLQHAGTCHSLLGRQQGWHETAGWPLRGGRGKKIQKYQKNTKKKIIFELVLYVAFELHHYRRHLFVCKKNKQKKRTPFKTVQILIFEVFKFFGKANQCCIL